MDLNASNWSFGINLVNQTINQCGINQEQIYSYMQHYPKFIFWFLVAAFISMVISLYFPLLFKGFYERQKSWLDNVFFVTPFFCLGVALVQMLPIVFNLTQADFDSLGKLNDVVLLLFLAFGGFWFFKAWRKADKVDKKK